MCQMSHTEALKCHLALGNRCHIHVWHFNCKWMKPYQNMSVLWNPKIEWPRWMMRFNYVEWIYTQFTCMENLLLQILLLTCFSCFYIFIEKSLICYLVFIYFLLSTFSFYLALLVTCLFQLFTIIFLTFLVIISCLECISIFHGREALLNDIIFVGFKSCYQ